MEKVKDGKRRIGDVINELSKKPKAIILELGDEKFALFIHPISDKEIFDKYFSLSETNPELADKFLIANALRDEDNKPVWKKPEDMNVDTMVLGKLKIDVFKRIFGVNLTEFAIKNSQGSPSSQPV